MFIRLSFYQGISYLLFNLASFVDLLYLWAFFWLSSLVMSDNLNENTPWKQMRSQLTSALELCLEICNVFWCFDNHFQYICRVSDVINWKCLIACPTKLSILLRNSFSRYLLKTYGRWSWCSVLLMHIQICHRRFLSLLHLFMFCL